MSSILGSKPFVDKILSSCSPDNLKTLLTLINNPGVPTTVYLYGNESVLNDSHKGVHYVQLMVDKLLKRYLYGYLVFIDNNNCGFFSFSGKQSPMIEIEIDPVKLTHNDIYENLSAEEFRRTLADLAIEAGEIIPDGIEVITLTGLSGTLTKDELELAASDHCVIMLGTQCYYRAFSGAGIEYKAATRINPNTGLVISEAIDIDKDTGAWTAMNDEQMNVAQLSGASFTGNITAPSGTFNELNGEANPSVKPIYCHPITIRDDNTNACLTCLIFNNDATPFTLSSFETWLENLATSLNTTARIMVSGAFKQLSTSKMIIASYLYATTNGRIGDFGEYADGTGYAYNENVSITDIFSSSVRLDDAVNKIN